MPFTQSKAETYRNNSLITGGIDMDTTLTCYSGIFSETEFINDEEIFSITLIASFEEFGDYTSYDKLKYAVEDLSLEGIIFQTRIDIYRRDDNQCIYLSAFISDLDAVQYIIESLKDVLYNILVTRVSPDSFSNDYWTYENYDLHSKLLKEGKYIDPIFDHPFSYEIRIKLPD